MMRRTRGKHAARTTPPEASAAPAPAPPAAVGHPHPPTRVAEVRGVPGQGGPQPPMVLVRDVTRTYGSGDTAVHALREASFTVPTGQLVAVVGRSGAGKTTLLNSLGGLDRPDAGRVHVAGREVPELGESGLAELRRDVLGFIFQSFGLLPMLSAVENVGIPMRLHRVPVIEREARARELLDLVGLSAHLDQRPHEMSGGQQQRVAIARALSNRPRLLIADEPTGQLDAATGAEIMALLRDVVHRDGMTGIISTHDPAMREMADRVITLQDGRIVGDTAG